MIWPFRKKQPDLEQRASLGVTLDYMSHRRKQVLTDAGVPLTATVGTATHYWQSGFAMLNDATGTLRPDVLAQMGRDLCMKGESVWHIRADGSALDLLPVAYWDELGRGKYHLHIARVNETETVKALAGEVLHLKINMDPVQPWKGRSPWQMMGLSPSLMSEIEGTFSTAATYAGKGLLPFPAAVSEEQKGKAISGLQSGALAVRTSKADYAQQTGGHQSEWRRVDLSADLQKTDFAEISRDLHIRLLTGCGIPPALMTENGNAGAMREAYRLFVLQTIQPLARQCLPELMDKLGLTSLTTDDMMSADVAGRARAVGILTGAGVSLDKALKMAGWDDD
ncbi:phage portal protein [Mameliella sediminis]|uniref:phage portal protein n=1 Tax=Mameliella sediminis TaxID=2836866 RepID=UPI001C462B71|nr:phage portal protein [Mameliella sediminis]MBV7393260.1 phage portal protein [Mameliella sediminis]